MENIIEYACDFETCINKKDVVYNTFNTHNLDVRDIKENIEVKTWSIGLLPIDYVNENKEFKYFEYVEELINYLIKENYGVDKILLYFHNMKYDGSYIFEFFRKENIRMINRYYSEEKNKYIECELENNTYSLFMKENIWYSLKFKYKNIIFEIYDTLKKAPFKLDAIGKAVGVKKLKDVLNPIEIKKDGYIYTNEFLNKEYKYLLNDVLIVAKFVKHCKSYGFENLTIGSFALEYWKYLLFGSKVVMECKNNKIKNYIKYPPTKNYNFKKCYLDLNNNLNDEYNIFSYRYRHYFNIRINTLFKENIQERKFDIKNPRYEPSFNYILSELNEKNCNEKFLTENKFLPFSIDHLELSIKAYRGGITTPFNNNLNNSFDGAKQIENCVSMDVTSEYPTIMYYYKLPVGEPVTFTDILLNRVKIKNLKINYKEKYKGLYNRLNNENYCNFLIVKVSSFKLKKDGLTCLQLSQNSLLQPVLDVKNVRNKKDLNFKENIYMEKKLSKSHSQYNKLMFSEPVFLCLTDIDYELYNENYDNDMEIIEGFCYKAYYNLFKDYIDYWLNKKENPKNQMEKFTSKLMLNSLYGKFGTKIENKLSSMILDECGILDKTYKVTDEIDDTIVDYGNYIYPPLSSYITASARKHLISGLKAIHNSDKYKLYYCDTDSQKFQITNPSEKYLKMIKEEYFKSLSYEEIVIKSGNHYKIKVDGIDYKCLEYYKIIRDELEPLEKLMKSKEQMNEGMSKTKLKNVNINIDFNFTKQLGTWEIEGLYSKGAFLQPKKYGVEYYNGKISMTLAGVSPLNEIVLDQYKEKGILKDYSTRNTSTLDDLKVGTKFIRTSQIFVRGGTLLFGNILELKPFNECKEIIG